MVVQTVFLGQPPSAACAFYTDFQDAIVLPHSDRYHSYTVTSIKMHHSPMSTVYIFSCDRMHINASLVSYS